MFWRSGKKSISKNRGTFLLLRTLATAETCDRILHTELRRTHSKHSNIIMPKLHQSQELFTLAVKNFRRQLRNGIESVTE